ncbi:unnamed protein product [Trichobilharzia szidati]|nr:unnamed protein product [Trichobilharzia szidati]
MHSQLRIFSSLGYDHSKVYRRFQLNLGLIKRWKTSQEKVLLENSNHISFSTTKPHWNLLHSESAYNPQLVENPQLCKTLWDRLKVFQVDSTSVSSISDNRKSVISMILPPPNVTGSLHVGHALTCAIQDAIARCYRMHGKTVVWIPGMDHAGIATQSIVERDLLKSYHHHHKHKESVNATDSSSSSVINPRLLLGREAFLNRIWDWKNEHAKLIREQLDSLGLCLDWSREFFTLSSSHSKCVTEAFLKLYNAGLIYRDESFVSWCCHLQTAISDIEVESRELSSSTFINVPGCKEPIEFGIMDYFAYRIIDPPNRSTSSPSLSSSSKYRQFDARPNEIIVATTRLETMLADVALVVHPEDERYQHFIGCHVEHPFCSNGRRVLPIIADGEFVKPEIGTGVVKLSPGHSPVDFELAKRHNLPVITIFDNSGCIINTADEFAGLPRFQARQRLVERLSELGLYKYRKDVSVDGGDCTILPICSRSGDIIEPMIRKQWFIKTKDLAKAAIEAVQSGQIEMIPSYQKLVWSEWLNPVNHKDWCISRQLWWGHPIPAYKISLSNQITERDGNEFWIVARSMDEAVQSMNNSKYKSCEYQITPDPDVLDTWFSSAILPFSVFGWPEKTKESYFYPLRLLETGQDILFFWVARMVMLGIFLTEQVPFKTVLLHGLVCDSAGQKMSKSKNNVINPLKIIHGIGNLSKETVGSSIQVLGADALRAALLTCQIHQPHIKFDENVVLEMRKFCNKIWQTARFVLIQLEKQNLLQSISASRHEPLEYQWNQYVGRLHHENKLRLFDIWIIYKLYRLTELINSTWIDISDTDGCDRVNDDRDDSGLNNENMKWSFHHGVMGLHNWWINDLCSIYLEVVKRSADSLPLSSKNSLQILYLCLITGIRLLHPIMPYLTEVIWHGININMERTDHDSGQFYTPEKCLLMETFPNIQWFNFLHDPESSPSHSLERINETMHELITVATNVNSWRTLLKSINETPHSEQSKGDDKFPRIYMTKISNNSIITPNTTTDTEDESSVLKALTGIHLRSEILLDRSSVSDFIHIPVYDKYNSWQLCINKRAYDLHWTRRELQNRIDKLRQRKEELIKNTYNNNLGKKRIGKKASTDCINEVNQSKIEAIERKQEKLQYQFSLLK